MNLVNKDFYGKEDLVPGSTTLAITNVKIRHRFLK